MTKLYEETVLVERDAGMPAAFTWRGRRYRVRDVIGHLLVGYTVPMEELGAVIEQYGGNIPLASKMASAEYAGARSPSELAQGYHFMLGKIPPNPTCCVTNLHVHCLFSIPATVAAPHCRASPLHAWHSLPYR